MRAAAERDRTVHATQRRRGRVVAQVHAAVHRRCTGDRGIFIDVNRTVDRRDGAGLPAGGHVDGSVDLGRLIALLRFTAGRERKHHRKGDGKTVVAESARRARVAAAENRVYPLPSFAHGCSFWASFAATVPVRLNTSTGPSFPPAPASPPVPPSH